MVVIKKAILLVLSILLISTVLYAGFSLGKINVIKNKVEEVDEDVQEIVTEREEAKIINVSVYPNHQWIDTGIEIKPGETLNIEASGTIGIDQSTYGTQNSQGYNFGPEGSNGTAVNNTPNVNGWVWSDASPNNGEVMHTYTLIAQMKSGTVNKKFQVGSYYNSAAYIGRLYLAINTWKGGYPSEFTGMEADICSGFFTAKISYE